MGSKDKQMEVLEDDIFICEKCGREEEDHSYEPLCLDCYHEENDEDE